MHQSGRFYGARGLDFLLMRLKGEKIMKIVEVSV